MLKCEEINYNGYKAVAFNYSNDIGNHAWRSSVWCRGVGMVIWSRIDAI